MALPVAGWGLDFVHGREENLANLERHGFPGDKWLGVGIVDGRNVWRTDLWRNTPPERIGGLRAG